MNKDTKLVYSDWVDSQIEDFINKYQASGVALRVDFRNLCSKWMWAKRSDAYTHYLHRYPAKLLPYIPIFFQSSSLPRNDIVLDPFAGTGTVGLESIIHFVHPRDCYLIEINPLARLISSAKVTPINPQEIEEKLSRLTRIIANNCSSKRELPQFPGIDFWFRKEAQIGLARVRDSIETLNADLAVKDFFWACYSATIRDMSRADPKVGPPVILSPKKFPKEQERMIQNKLEQKSGFEATTLFKGVAYRNIKRMQEFWDVMQKLPSNNKAQVVGQDARKLTIAPYLGKGYLNTSENMPIKNDSIGMVITSPPYINAQKYTRTTKFELWWLGLIEDNAHALIEFDKQLIGTERVPFNEYSEVKPVGNVTADELIQKVYDIEPLKAGIISQYFRDMRMALGEITRVLQRGGYLVLVVGNNLVFKQQVPNNQILAEIAHEEGLIIKAMLVDEIRSRGLITKRHETAGMILDEWIVLLQKPDL